MAHPTLSDGPEARAPGAEAEAGAAAPSAGTAGPRVHKFGGTSVDGGKRLLDVARIIGEQEAPCVVVVSAMAGVTDVLSGLAGPRVGASDGCEPTRETDARSALDGLGRRHREVAAELARDGESLTALEARIDHILDRVRAALDAMPESGSDRTRDRVMAAGEDLAVELAVAALKDEGISATALDARSLVWTDSCFGAAVPDVDAVGRLARERILPLLDDGLVTVIQGFVGRDVAGATTTLGRGGSDFTATLLAAALGAPEVVIWTDVDGILSGDPGSVAGARVLPEIGFEEAVELAYFGARVIHPTAAKHAIAGNVLVRVRNTFRPANEGTVIHFDRRGVADFAAVAHKPEVVLIKVRAFPSAMAYGFLARVFEVLARHRVPVDLVATSHSSTAFTIDRNEELAEARRELAEFAEVEVVPNMATVTVVGHGLLKEPRLSAKVLRAVEGTPVHLISQASDVSLSFVVDEDDAPDLVRSLHTLLIEVRVPAETTL